MPSFAISKFTVLLEPLWVSAKFLFLSTDPLLYIIIFKIGVLSRDRTQETTPHSKTGRGDQ